MPKNKNLIAKVAYLYYEEGRNQNDIAKEMNIHRSTVSRMIKQAWDEGIIELKFKLDSPPLFSLEEYFKNKYELKDVLIVSNSRLNAKEKENMFYDEAAYYVYRNIDKQKTIGVTWGSTLGQTINHITYQKQTNATFVPLVGGPNRHINVEYHVNTLIYELAQKFGGNSIFINATVVQENSVLSQGIMNSKYFQEILNYWNKLDLAIVGIGGKLESKKSQWRDLLQPQDHRSLKELNIAGDCCCRFYNEEGESIVNDLSDRTIGVTLETLKNVPQTIGIAYSKEKVSAIFSAIKGKFINTLITDSETALEILKLDGDSNVSRFTELI